MKGGGKWGPPRSDPGGRSHFGGYGSGNVQELFNKQLSTGINFEEAHKQPVEVSPKDPNCPPLDGFESGGLCGPILENIKRCGYRSPTPIQKHGIPIVLAGKDLVACAQTGSGKTAAFLLPTIHRLLEQGFNASRNRMSHIGALVLAPTRELASQIFEEAQKFCYQTTVRPAVAYGGADQRPQAQALEMGVEILVATPGRFIDHQERGRVSLVDLVIFIMDEADRMLDMGFEPQIRQICSQRCGMPRRRQTLMFSATFPEAVQSLAQDFVGRQYTFMTVGRVGSTHSYIKQSLMWVEDQDKKLVLLGVLMGNPGMTLVFCNTKTETNNVTQFLCENGIRAEAIHGDRSQSEREYALRMFKSGRTAVLCATDVAARGLDIQGVALVVQYDLPTDVDDYVHRMGRTGRAGNQGIAIGFANGRNKGLSPDLATLLSEAQQTVPAWLTGMALALGGPTAVKTVSFGGQDVRVTAKRSQASKEPTVHHSFDANAYGSALTGDG